FNPPAAQLVQSRVADMADRRSAILDDRDGEHAGHPAPFGPQRRRAADLVVRNGDRLADAVRDGSGFALETRAQHPHREVRGFPAGRLPADTIDDDEESTNDVDVKPVLVDLALQARIRLAGGSHGTDRLHDAINARLRRSAASRRPT